jgi:aspartyl-tRNA(Asn)/glutamyl-tRNA(Gln) amidotransferase subunit A
MTMPKPTTITELTKGLREKRFSAVELVQESLKNIQAEDPKIGAFLRTLDEKAVKDAAAADEALAAGTAGPLTGIPVALKDNMLVEGEVATGGSKILATYRASYDAGVVKKLADARAVILGKTNLDEFAMGSSTENSAFHVTRNPHDLERVAGGSSGGSAAAVAAGFVPAALGSDTGGSIRQPAAFCGVVGLKPTYGAVSRSGLMAMASSLDQIGPFTRTVEDARLVFNGIRGYDPLDATSSPELFGEIGAQDEARLRTLTLGIPEEYFIPGLDPQVGAAVEKVIGTYTRAGFAVKRISLPHTKYALSTYYIVMPAEVSANLARFDGIRYERPDHAGRLEELYLKTRGQGFGREAKRRIILGTFVLSSGYYDAYYGKAQAVRSLIKRDFDEAFREVDVVLAPVTPTPAFKIGEKSSDPLAMYLSDIFTIPVNLAGLPGLTVPCRDVPALPIGFQLIGKPFHEPDILGLGEWYEKTTG